MRYLFQPPKAPCSVQAGGKDGDGCLTLLNLKLGCLLQAEKAELRKWLVKKEEEEPPTPAHFIPWKKRVTLQYSMSQHIIK